MQEDNLLIGAIDQGTSSSRFLVFSAKDFQLITYHQVPIKLISDQAGWVEIDPQAIIDSVVECIEKVSEYLAEMGLSHKMIKTVGLTNQRETTILWDKVTGKPLHNAIVWLDTRTHSTVDEMLAKCNNNPNYLKMECGLPFSTYFSALKIKWLIDNVAEVKEAIRENRCAFGTVDSWILWVGKI
ncbi:glycerol kinase-like isoform X1 [Brachionus plicatilis]|uniref:glycerol kinase n=1 Tax=Brachionus plicatilis TaxID=10195 RepID=A0A3M7PFZ2_BRAPC|nr:glycerol kinase-like isoform X1 [Brachionus plicatilis]